MKECLERYGTVLEHASLKKYNTYRLEQSARYVFFPNSILDLVEGVRILKKQKIKFFILGNGSNIVLGNSEYEGVVLVLQKLNGIEVHPEMNLVYAEAGVLLPTLVRTCLNYSLTGLEFAAGIPGSVGGSIYGNAGAYNSALLDYVKSVTILDENLDIKTLEYEDISYGYRTSMFKENKQCIILAAKFFLKPGDKEKSFELIQERNERRKETQPLEYPSSGSVFRNPEGDYSGRLIESCGLKGYCIGEAEISKKHANFVINKGNATCQDIHDLIVYVHDQVLLKTGVDLVIEQEFIDWE